MRMWNVTPTKMCDKHLLGEHVECHMFVGTLNKKKSVQGYLDKGLLEIHNLKKRHNELAKEMRQRGIKHKSPLPEFELITMGKINSKENEIELKRRCVECNIR